MLKLPSLIQIATSRADLYAFRITGEVSSDDMGALAEHMNAIFDRPGKVDLLMIFDRYDGAETGASLGWEAIKSRVRALVNVNRYVVVGTPERTQSLISALGAVIPVEAEAHSDEMTAWRSLNAEAVAA